MNTIKKIFIVALVLGLGCLKCGYAADLTVKACQDSVDDLNQAFANNWELKSHECYPPDESKSFRCHRNCVSTVDFDIPNVGSFGGTIHSPSDDSDLGLSYNCKNDLGSPQLAYLSIAVDQYAAHCWYTINNERVYGNTQPKVLVMTMMRKK
jgi:hypothetical protein